MWSWLAMTLNYHNTFSTRCKQKHEFGVRCKRDNSVPWIRPNDCSTRKLEPPCWMREITELPEHSWHTIKKGAAWKLLKNTRWFSNRDFSQFTRTLRQTFRNNLCAQPSPHYGNKGFPSFPLYNIQDGRSPFCYANVGEPASHISAYKFPAQI